jgi:hypothetical protein
MLAKMYKIVNIKAPLVKYVVCLSSYMVQNPKHLVEYLNYCEWLQNAPRCAPLDSGFSYLTSLAQF